MKNNRNGKEFEKIVFFNYLKYMTVKNKIITLPEKVFNVYRCTPNNN